MLSTTDNPAPFADAAALIAEALGAYLPREAISIPEHAAAHRWLDNRGGGYVGRWSNDEAPYLVGPMEALSSHDYLTVVVAGPGRSGKTAIAENWFLHSVDVDPADMLWYEPTDDAVESYVKRVIVPMIEAHKELRDRLGTSAADRSLHFKRFGPMWCEFLTATYSNLIGKTAGRIVLDEIDACTDRDGDPYRLADVRRQSFGPESKIFVCSHPDQAEGTDPAAWNRGIMRLYAQSTRAIWYWPCPHCNGFSSPNPTAARVMTLHYPAVAPLDEIAEATRLLCPICGALIEDKWRRPMNTEGRWIRIGETIDEDGNVTGTPARRDIAGFWIVGAMSPFVLGGIGALARDLVSAEREAEASGDDRPVRDVMAKRWGIPAAPRRDVGSLDAVTIAERTEPLVLGEVPEGVRFLTAAIDVQANRFEVLVRGWGVGGESWLIDYRRVTAETAVSAADWDALLKGLLTETWPLAGGVGRLPLRCLGYDTGGAPGTTQQGYDAWTRMQRARLARFLGVIAGREAYTLMPAKGNASPAAARLQVVHPTTRRTDRKARAFGDMPLLLIGADAFKNDLAGQLAVAEDGPWRVHIPEAWRGNFPAEPVDPSPPHTLLEQLVAERRKPNGRWEKVRPSARNELLDLMVMSHALAELVGLRRIDWTKPPAWAAEWNCNSMVRTGAPPGAAPVPPPAPAAVRAPGAPLRSIASIRTGRRLA